MKVVSGKSLRLRGEDGEELIVRHANRGDPYRQGIDLSLMKGIDGYIADIFLEDHEAKEFRDLLNRLYPQ